MKNTINIKILELKDQILATKEAEKIAEARADSKLIWLIDILGGEAIPVIGDIVTALYFYQQSTRFTKHCGLSLDQKNKIRWYYIRDVLLGLIPGLGLIGDIFYRANNKTAKLLIEHRKTLETILIEYRTKPVNKKH